MKKTTKEEIKEQILKTFQEKKEHFKGKIPRTLKDIPPKYLQPSYMKNVRDYKTGGWKKERVENVYWTKARTKVSNSKRPKKTLDLLNFKEHINKTIVKPRKERAQTAFKGTNGYSKVTPRQERVHHNNNTISITLPSNMSATQLIDLIAIIKKSGAKCSL